MRSFLLRVICTALLVSAVLATDTLPFDDEPQAGANHHGETVWSIGKPNTPRIGLIGDSTLAGVRWRNIYGDLAKYNYVFNAESCRRTIATSCRGREGYPPANALDTLRFHRGQWGRVLVMMTGYNDPGTRFGDGVDAIVREAKRQGIKKVVWLTMRTADVSYESPDYRSDSYTFRDNNRILLQKAVQHRGYLQIADWATRSADRPDWVGNDGIHLTDGGARGVTTFISNQTRQVLNGKTITPAPNASGHRTWSPLRQGAMGSRVVSLQRALMNAGISLYGGADGQFGSYTRQAVERYQRREGLPVSGVVYERMAIKLGIYTPPPPAIAKPSCKISRVLHPGDKLTSVRCLKLHLAHKGFDVDTRTRHFGTKAADAVWYYKTVRGMNSDRVAGGTMVRSLSAWKQPPPKPDCRMSRTLRPGDKLTDVRCLKRHLRARGFHQGSGPRFGIDARLAVRHVRGVARMKVHGTAGPDFLQHIRAWTRRPSKPDCTISRWLRPGDSAPKVRCLKQHLRSWGFIQYGGPDFGSNTKLAVRHVKINHGLEDNGIAGPKLLRRIGAWAAPKSATTTRAPADTEPSTIPPSTVQPSTTEPAPTTVPEPTTAPTTAPSTSSTPSTEPTSSTTPTTEPADGEPATTPPDAPPATSPSTVPESSVDPAVHP